MATLNSIFSARRNGHPARRCAAWEAFERDSRSGQFSDQELADNAATPFPAYTPFGIALYEGSVAVPEWSDEELVNSTRQCLLEAKACIDSNHPLRSINAFMELVAAFNVDIQKRVPDTAWNFWTERMTCHFVQG